MTYPFTPGERLTAADLNAALEKARDDAVAALGAAAARPEDFGAAGDGAADDTAALQALFAALHAANRPARVVLAGRYRVTARVRLRCAHHLRVEWTPGAEIVNDVRGAGLACWEATHPSIPDRAPWPGPGPAPRDFGGITLVNPRFVMGGAYLNGDTARPFRWRHCQGLYIEGQSGACVGYGNTGGFELSGVFNSRLGALLHQSHGHAKLPRETVARYTVAAGSTALASNIADFGPGDAGRVLQLYGAGGTCEFVTIASVGGATGATLAQPARHAFSAARGVFAPVNARCLPGTASVAGTLEVEFDAPCLTATDLGRRLYVRDAMPALTAGFSAEREPFDGWVEAVLSPTRARVRATYPAAPALVDASAWSAAIFDPAAEFYSEPFGGENNDADVTAWDLEPYTGAGLVLCRATNVQLNLGKIHTEFLPSWQDAFGPMPAGRVSGLGALICGTSGVSWQQPLWDHVGNDPGGHVHLSNVGGVVTISDLTCALAARQPLLRHTKAAPGTPGASAGEVVLDGATVWNGPAQASLDEMFAGPVRLAKPVVAGALSLPPTSVDRLTARIGAAAFSGASFLVGTEPGGGGAVRGALKLRRTSGTSFQWLVEASNAAGAAVDALGVSGDGVFVAAPFALGAGALPVGAADQILGRAAGSGQARPVLVGTGLSLRVDGGTGQTFLDSTGTGSGHVAFAVRDEGAALGTAGTVDALDFTGAGVTATRAGNVVTVTVPGGGGGGVTDGDKGDVVVSGGGAVWTVDARAVTFAKLQAVGTGRLLGRASAGSGDAEELTAAQARTLLGLGGAATLNVGAGAGTVAAGDHTHTPAQISGFAEAVDDEVASLLVAGANVTLTYDDAANTLTIAAAGGGGATNLSYNAAAREVRSDTGTDAVLPLFTDGAAGLVPASGGGTANFLRADGVFAAPAGGGTPTLSGPNLLLGRLSAGAGAAEEVRHPTVVTPGARLLPGGWQRGMWVPCINGNLTCALAHQRLEVWPILWTWNEPFDRFRFAAAVAYAGGSTSLEVALFDGAGARLAYWSVAGALGATGVQVSPALASPVNPGPGVLFLHVLPQFSGGTGAPTLVAAGQPITPVGALGLNLTGAARAVFSATLAGQTAIGASPAVPNTMTNSNLPLFGMDTA